MKFVEEYRNGRDARRYSDAIHKITTGPWKIMEVCGGQTHAIVKFGIDQLLPDDITLLHGPGCPVCVTPTSSIDKAIAIAQKTDVIFCSFGDMLRVPGTKIDLFMAKANGADVRIVYSPLDALKIAKDNPQKKIVFFAIGFETTAPANAMAIYQANRKKIYNFFALISHVLVPPAIVALLSSPTNAVQGFLAAGHVCTVMGYYEYQPIVDKYKIPIVVTGFEPLDILQGLYMCICQLEEQRAQLENQYTRSVSYQGNQPAQKIINEVFTITDCDWRGMGKIPQSGFTLHPTYQRFNAEQLLSEDIFSINNNKTDCISGLVLQGLVKPNECPFFAKTCSPEHPLGATMVSNEGACAAYYRYRLET